jgi:EmrB/QacA subfamily drug resistance transporter
MSLFDFFVVNVAIPNIQQRIHASTADVQLVVGGYAFAFAAFLITGGRLGDRHSYRRLFLGGMAFFTIASAGCGLAQTPLELIVARVAQGFAAAMMVPQVLGLITALFPAWERHRALAWFGATVGMGMIAGQILGGALVQIDLFGWGWRTIFFVNVPIGLATVALAAPLLPNTRSATKPQLDLGGVLAVSGSLALALVPLTIGRSEGWPWWMIALLCIAAPGFFLAARYEARLARRGGQPVLDLSLFQARSFSAGIAINALVYAYFGSIMLGFTLFLQRGLGLSALDAGLTFAPLGVAFAATSLLARPLIARHGSLVVRGGLVAVTLALVGLLLDIHLSGTATDPARLAPIFFLIGIANGLTLPAMLGASLTDVAPHKAGAAAGALTTSQQFAAAAGVALLSEIFFAALGGRPSVHTYLHAIQYVVLLDVALLVACVTASWLLPVRRPLPASASPARQSSAAEPSVRVESA